MRRPRGPARAGLAVGIFLLTLPAAVLAAESYQIDPVHSFVVFRIDHLGVSSAWGRFNEIAGRYTFDPAEPANSSFEVTIQSESVDTRSDKRDQHLRSPDFFNVKQFPVIRLKSKSVKKKADKTYQVLAELTLHGVTKEVPLEVRHVGSGKDPWGGYRSGFETQFTIRRSEFGMRFMPEGLGDEVTVFVAVEGLRQ